MTGAQAVITISIVAAATFMTRSLPFILFPSGKSAPAYVKYLGSILPYATIAMLIVYCLKGITPLEWPHGIPELIAIGTVVFVQLKKHNLILSIAIGFAVYMVLIRTVFAVA
jgi:branched-subunit amino acid transport protein AzlD